MPLESFRLSITALETKKYHVFATNAASLHYHITLSKPVQQILRMIIFNTFETVMNKNVEQNWIAPSMS